jgi:hypothetical protein
MKLKHAMMIGVFAAVLLSPVAIADEDAKQSATGHVDVVAPPFSNVDKYSFSAISHPNGSVSGEFEFRQIREGVELRVHGSVDCIVVVGGKRARIGGTVRTPSRETAPFFPAGTQFIWSVTDNGEGHNDPPDTASELLQVPGVAPNDVFSYCSAGGFPPEAPLRRGNVQVRP